MALAAVPASEAAATVPATLHAPANCTQLTPAPGATAWKCDDGLPDAGGMTPNLTGAKAITVPAKYQGFEGLPAKALDAGTIPGANPVTGTVALDVDVTLPGIEAPAGGYPLIFLMHGCCGGSKASLEQDSIDAGGEAWHYSNAWFAARGYVVVTYTSRGFVNGELNGNKGSTGQMQLQSRRFEINDYQSLACQIHGAARTGAFDDVTGGQVRINPARVVTTSGSYGGGFSWMTLTDPRWSCTPDTGSGAAMSLAATAPKYGWTDVIYSLAPTGAHSHEPGSLPATDGCDSGPRRLDTSPCPGGGVPVGPAKRSILAGLYATGKFGIPPLQGSHTTFPSWFDQGVICLEGAYPYEASPLCANSIQQRLPELLRESSAYYQNNFFSRIANQPGYRVPVYSAASFTDPLFPPHEHRRMLNRLRSVVPDYPIESFHGDYQHFVQNKEATWVDLCNHGGLRERCVADDYPGGDYGADPPNLVRTGVTTRVNRFLDRYARPPANADEPEPDFDVTAELQVCPQNAPGLGVSPGDPGPTFTAPTFEQLAPDTLELALSGNRTTTSIALPNLHGIAADPVGNERTNGRHCPFHGAAVPAGPGVAVYTSAPLDQANTMIGATRVTAAFQPSTAAGLQLNARLYDVFPNGTAVMVDRGPRRLTDAEAQAGSVTFELHSNAWRFEEGHRVRIELAQDDGPYLVASTTPSTLSLSGVELELPVRGTVGGRCANALVGTDASESLLGTTWGDRVEARRGNDIVRALRGRDCLRGERGRDRLKAGRGADVVKGGAGKDRLRGGRGRDRLRAADGKRDRVNCGGGRDRARVDARDSVRRCERVRT